MKKIFHIFYSVLCLQQLPLLAMQMRINTSSSGVLLVPTSLTFYTKELLNERPHTPSPSSRSNRTPKARSSSPLPRSTQSMQTTVNPTPSHTPTDQTLQVPVQKLSLSEAMPRLKVLAHYSRMTEDSIKKNEPTINQFLAKS